MIRFCAGRGLGAPGVSGGRRHIGVAAVSARWSVPFGAHACDHGSYLLQTGRNPRGPATAWCSEPAPSRPRNQDLDSGAGTARREQVGGHHPHPAHQRVRRLPGHEVTAVAEQERPDVLVEHGGGHEVEVRVEDVVRQARTGSASASARSAPAATARSAPRDRRRSRTRRSWPAATPPTRTARCGSRPLLRRRPDGPRSGSRRRWRCSAGAAPASPAPRPVRRHRCPGG